MLVNVDMYSDSYAKLSTLKLEANSWAEIRRPPGQ